MKSILRGSILVLITLTIIKCERSELKRDKQLTSETAESSVKQLIKAFFTGLPSFKEDGSGLYRVNNSSFKKYINSTYLKDYKPKPNENSRLMIKNLMNDSAWFFRIELPSIDQLFIVKGYNFTVSVGRAKLIDESAEKAEYQVMFTKRDSKGRAYQSKARMTYYKNDKYWQLQLSENNRLKLNRVKENKQKLIDEYATFSFENLTEY